MSPPLPLTYVICDVFTDRPLTGNQVAVFTDAGDVDESLMRPLAREINFSETVFVLPSQAGGDFRIRIFTPRVELPFAGHPTLGAGWVLARERHLQDVVLETAVGPVPLEFRRGEDGWRGRMLQPTPTVAPYPQAEELLSALGVERSLLPVEVYDVGPTHVFVRLGSEREVAALRPDLNRLGSLSGLVGASCFAGDGDRYTARVFCPWVGIAEDPATGSAAGPLAMHLVRHGAIPPGREIVISQGAEIGRPATLLAIASGTPEAIADVRVGGAAVIVGQGQFTL